MASKNRTEGIDTYLFWLVFMVLDIFISLRYIMQLTKTEVLAQHLILIRYAYNGEIS